MTPKNASELIVSHPKSEVKMIVYLYFDDDAPSGIQAFPSFRKACSARAQAFPKNDRPELFKVTIAKPTKAVICACLNHEGYAELMEAIA